MDSLFANTTNHRRFVMFIATGLAGVFMVLVIYGGPISPRVFIESGIVGLLVFEVMFRTQKWLNLQTLILYAVLTTVISQYLYHILYGGPLLQLPLGLSTFPYNLYALIESSIATGIAYYLIKVYRKDSWMISESGSTSAGEKAPAAEEPPSSLRAWLQTYNQQIMGFVGWYLFATLLGNGNTLGLITTPGTLIGLIVFARSKQSKGVAGGILIAVALNFVISMVRGLGLNAWCMIPFYNDIYFY